MNALINPPILETDPLRSAEAAGLRYVPAGELCIHRVRVGRGFRYILPGGRRITDRKTLERIRSLAIPPAWRDVLICPSPRGHLQAVGRDARGRKQYRYHPQYRAVRDESKFGRLIAFGAVLARIRQQAREDLKRPGLPREKVLAAVVLLLESTLMRVGNEEYARDNESFGITTLRNKHVRLHGATIKFRFRGKSGQEHSIELSDRRLAGIIRQCRDLPGYELFQYVDANGELRPVDSADVNDYLRAITGEEFSAKDFRTWAGTILAARELAAVGAPQTATAAKKGVAAAIRNVAQRLGNRPATCRKYYVHPAVIDAYTEGKLFERMHEGARQEEAYDGQGLRAEEYSVVTLVAQHQQQQVKRARRRAARATTLTAGSAA